MLSCYHDDMAASTRDNTKTRKPRADETGELVGVRLQRGPLTDLDEWRRRQPDLPSRPEAIRRLVELALTKKP